MADGVRHHCLSAGSIALVDRRRREGQELGEGEREVLAFLPPALHVVDGWRSRGLATGDSIILLANGQGTPKQPLASSRERTNSH